MTKQAYSFLLAAAFVAASAAGGEEAPSTVATWQGGSLERADYESWRTFHELEDGPEAIREMAYVVSLAQSTRQRGADKELRTRLEVEATRQQVLLEALRRRIEAEVTVSDEEVETYVRDHAETFRRPRKLRMRNVYKRLGDDAAATRERMRDIHRQLSEGADFEAMARRESESQTRFRGGLVGFVDPDELPPAVGAAVRDLAPGELSGVVEHGDGVSIFLCEDIRGAREPALDELRSKVLASFLRQRVRERWTDFQERLFAEAEPRLRTSGPVAIEMEGYRLSAEDLAELVPLRFPDKEPSELPPAQIEGLLRSWAVGILGVRRATAEKLDQDPEVAAALRWRHLGVLARRELVRRVDGRLREPNEKELRRQFEAKPRRYSEEESYELAVIHFGAPNGVTSDPSERVRHAVDVARRLESGELTFEDAARRYSDHPSAAAGGLLGWQSSRQLASWGPVAAKALRQLDPGELSGLMRLESGLWIFELRAHRDARPLAFEAARQQVRDDLRQQQIQELESTVRQEHLEKLGLRIQGR